MKRDPTDRNGASQVVCDRRAARIIRITSWSGIVVGSVQTLLIGLALWIIADLIAYGTRITAAGIVLSIGAFVNYCVVVAAAWGLGRYRRWGLWVFGILQLFPLMVFCVLSNNGTEWFVADESTLPPNEVFGRTWVIGVIFLPMGLAAMLGIVPILLFSVVLFRPRCRRLFGRP